MRRYSHDFHTTAYDYDIYNQRKPSAAQSYYDYNGCYPEGYELADDMPTLVTVDI